ncbi:hypothetical protein [Phenylobacterium sp.]|nr:hypothetical protein [Phenylobacterium sp.]
MTTECIDQHHFEARQSYLHDAVIGLVVAVVFVIPATLAVFTFL